MPSPFPDANTPVVVVGGTGRYGSAQIAGMRAAGTNIVANVAPGRGGTVINSARPYVVLSLGVGLHFDVFGK